jgi:hypothetical protein
VPWCKFFIPKIASPRVKPDDPDFNDSVMYAKCIKGHVLKNADDWILCENLPAPDAKCWQEGGDTIFSLMFHQQKEAQAEQSQQDASDEITPQRAIS